MDFIKIIVGIFFPKVLEEDEDYDLELETTIDIYSGNAFDGGEVKEAKAYDRYSVS